MTVPDFLTGAAFRVGESIAAATVVGVVFQMSTPEIGLAFTVFSSAVGIVWGLATLRATQRAMVKAIKRIDRRTARLEQHAFGISAVDEEQELADDKL